MKALVIGLGNRWRGDDAIGAQVLDLLRAMKLGNVELLDCPGDNMDLINHWQGREHAYVIDACYAPELAAGTLLTIENAHADDRALTQLRHPTSSHVLDLQQAIALSEVLEQAPAALTVYAIAGSRFETGSQPQAEVEAAGLALAEQLAAQLSTQK